jgi:hypothetical protein
MDADATRELAATARYAWYVPAVVAPPCPVQFVWNASPRGRSTRSYVWAPK